jgi:hypothetical protein
MPCASGQNLSAHPARRGNRPDINVSGPDQG